MQSDGSLVPIEVNPFRWDGMAQMQCFLKKQNVFSAVVFSAVVGNIPGTDTAPLQQLNSGGLSLVLTREGGQKTLAQQQSIIKQPWAEGNRPGRQQQQAAGGLKYSQRRECVTCYGRANGLSAEEQLQRYLGKVLKTGADILKMPRLLAFTKLSGVGEISEYAIYELERGYVPR